MTMKVLIGYDGSEFAKHSITDLQRAGLPAEVEATVLAATEVWPRIPESMSAAATDDRESLPLTRTLHELASLAKHDAERTASEGAALVRSIFPGWSVVGKAVFETPGRALVEFADQWKPDLLVVGAHGRSTAAQLLTRVLQGVGSVSHKVLRFAPCSVRIGRPPHELSRDSGGPVRLLLGIDGSTASAAVVQAVAMRRWPTGSEARLVAAIDLRMLTLLPFIGVSGLALEHMPSTGKLWARRAVDRASDDLKESSLAVTTAVLDGEPRRVLLHEAAEWGADCIFVGAHGLSRFERFMVGTVSAGVAERAACSVEVVRHPGSAT